MFLLVFIFALASAAPVDVLLKAADNDFENLDNYLPKVGDFPKFHYSTFGENIVSDEDIANLIEFKSSHKEKPESFGEMADFVEEESSKISKMTSSPQPGSNNTEETTTVANEEVTTQILENQDQIDPVDLEEDVKDGNRTMRQEDFDNEVEGSGDSKEKESQESEEEEEPNMITGLISAFLGGLSRPDGSVDIEAITGLLGSLSTQNPDGTYDFSGLTELLMSFFGGEGGSDFGAFIGGLAGAFLQGIANPPGAKGVGVFLGNLVGAILPGLSAPAPTEEGEPQKPQQPLDSGGFLSGLLSSLLGNVGNLSGGGSSGGDNAGGGGNKFSLFKAIFSTITSVFSSSSSTAH